MQATPKRIYKKRKQSSPRNIIVTVRVSDEEKAEMEKIMNELNIKSYSKAMSMALQYIPVDYFDNYEWF